MYKTFFQTVSLFRIQSPPLSFFPIQPRTTPWSSSSSSDHSALAHQIEASRRTTCECTAAAAAARRGRSSSRLRARVRQTRRSASTYVDVSKYTELRSKNRLVPLSFVRVRPLVHVPSGLEGDGDDDDEAGFGCQFHPGVSRYKTSAVRRRRRQ